MAGRRAAFRRFTRPATSASHELILTLGVLLLSSACHRNWPLRLDGEFFVAASAGALLSDGTAVVAGNHAGALALCGVTEGQLGEGAAFLMKLSRRGACSWARRLRAPVEFASAGGVAVGPADELYWSGSERGGDSMRGFVERVDAGGRPRWTFSVIAEHLVTTSLAADGSGAAVSLLFRGTLQIGSMMLVARDKGGKSDGLVAKLGPDGQLQWIAQLSGLGRDTIRGIALLPDGRVLATGEIDATTSCGRPAGEPATRDAYIARFELGRPPVCKTVRAGAAVSGARARGTAIAWRDGMATVVGVYGGPLEVGTATLASALESADEWPDAFVATFDAQLNPQWAARLDSPHVAEPVAVSAEGGRLTVGTNYPAAVIRLTASGRPQWRYQFPEHSTELIGMAENKCGSLLLYGRTAPIADRSPNSEDGLVLPLSPNGTPEAQICSP